MNDPETADLYEDSAAKAFYDRRYTRGYMDEWSADHMNRVAALIGDLGLPANGRVLDFGCGSGAFTEVLREALPGWSACGTDLSENALAKARERHPECSFFGLEEAEKSAGSFDLLFSHHVFEHVSRLSDAWRDCVSFLKPVAGMLHILPCGNEGSLEHRLSTLRTDGIDPALGNRFFFEDVGHLRRLTTDEMVQLAGRDGLRLKAEAYANQHHGGLRWIADAGEKYVLTLTDTSRAKSPDAAKEILKIRKQLLRIVRAERFTRRYRGWIGKLGRSPRFWLGSILGAPAYLLSRHRVRSLVRDSENEWRNRRGERNGSEMYLYFERTA